MPGMASNQLSQLQSQMSGASALELAKAALAQGASPSQIAQLVRDLDASPDDLAAIQNLVQDHAASKGMANGGSKYNCKYIESHMKEDKNP